MKVATILKAAGLLLARLGTRPSTRFGTRRIALSVGALAAGSLAIGRLAGGKAKFKRAHIGELELELSACEAAHGVGTTLPTRRSDATAFSGDGRRTMS